MEQSNLHSPSSSTFPSPFPGSGSRQAPSIISSRMTDVASEDGDEFQTEEALRPSTAASNDPNRPGSALSSQTRPSTRAPPSRRGKGSPLGGFRAGGAFGGPGGSITNSSRPTSSTSKTSRTHVPSLASHAFFKPMSSQRLQAQRSARLPRPGKSTISTDGGSETGGTNTNRHSLVTNATEQQEALSQREHDPMPVSRGTEFTDQEERGFGAASPTEDATIRSMGGSERPLQKPTHLDVERQGNGASSKLSRSFSANFRRGIGSTPKETHGHERLASSISPTFAKQPPSVPPKAGINYQYFSGNTIFFLGGRLQNTRDRPINIGSGLVVFIPSILFVVYSWVTASAKRL